jgi:dTDP-4-dehydrorhamnose 3,5-epimerase
MEIKALSIPDVLVILPRVVSDTRGYFVESFNKRALADVIGNVEFVQDNQSLSRAPFTIRGLHFQINSSAQAKLIRVLQGSVLDVVVDLRRKSPHYGKHAKALLSATGFEQLWVPSGFAHGFCTLEPNTVVFYKITNFFDPDGERGLRWNDPELGIDWGVEEKDVTLSAKDSKNPFLRELPTFF